MKLLRTDTQIVALVPRDDEVLSVTLHKSGRIHSGWAGDDAEDFCRRAGCVDYNGDVPQRMVEVIVRRLIEKQ